MLAKSVKTGFWPVAVPVEALTGAGVGCGRVWGFGCGCGLADCAMILSCRGPLTVLLDPEA